MLTMVFKNPDRQAARVADASKIIPENVEGDFFVDSTCINCDTCRQLAPASFADQGQFSFVYAQPHDEDAKRAATRALLCCPTGSIGTMAHNESKNVIEDLPLRLEENVFYCGFNSAKSYGGNSFFVQHLEGNWLIDSPKFVPHLVRKFRELGGIKYIFLTHQDDVADAERYATEFSAERFIHRTELASQPAAERVVDGDAEIQVSAEFKIIPVPGHTRGHMVLLYKEKYLFTGDHLAFDTDSNHLMAFRRHCWYSWETQTKSMERLLDYQFEWVLAGHGNLAKLDKAVMHAQLSDLVEWMKLPSREWFAKFADS